MSLPDVRSEGNWDMCTVKYNDAGPYMENPCTSDYINALKAAVVALQDEVTALTKRVKALKPQ